MSSKISMPLLLLSLACLHGCSETLETAETPEMLLATQVSYRRVDSNGRFLVDVDRIAADLQSVDWKVRRRAADAVPWKSDSDFTPVVPLLLDCLNSSPDSLQFSAVHALYLISRGHGSMPPQTVPALKKIIESSAPVENRRWAIMAVGKITQGTENEAATIAMMITQLRDPEDQIFRRAADVLGDIGSPAGDAVPEIVRQLSVSRFRALIASKVLARILTAPDLCVPAMIIALQQPDAPEKQLAKSLAAFGTAAAPALPKLIPLLSRGDGNIVNAAALAIGELGTEGRNAAKALGTALQKAGDRREVQMHTMAALCAIGPAGQKVLATHLESVKTFRIYDAGFGPLVNGKILQSLAEAGGLTQLDLGGATISPDALQPISRMRQLHELIMPKGSGDEHLQHIARLTDLRRLKTGEAATNAGMQHLSKLTSLTELHIARSFVSDVGLQPLSGMHELRRLRIDATISGDGLDSLKNARQLELLTFADVSDNALRHLTAFRNLHTLEIRSRTVTNAATVHLRQLSSLQKLDLSHSAIDDVGIHDLANHLSQLRELDLYHCPITADCVEDLCRFKQLKSLGVYATPLAGMRDVLNMSQTSAVQTLIRELPDCSVTYAD